MAAHNRLCLYLSWLLMAAATRAAEVEPAEHVTHPLMPGIRSTEMWNRDWPRTHHDKLATGFSPLVCGMKAAPKEWSTIEMPGQARWLWVVSRPGEDDLLLVDDSHLRLLSRTGQESWSIGAAGNLLYCGELHGDGRQCLLLGSGRYLREVELATGKTLWTHEFQPAHVDPVVRVADILPERSGLEAAVFLNHGEEGTLWSFPPNSQPNLVWQKKVVKQGEFDERYDHHSGIELDLSQPAEPVIWNVRRYRCRGIDARSGEIISSLEYEIGGEPRRNYGTWALGKDRHGQPLAVVLGESVQLHAHAIRLNRTGQNELAWQHYYGEVYKDAPGVALEHLAIADLDGDGTTELAYSIRDPARDYRSFVRVRDAETGEIEFELADHWGAAVLPAGDANPTTLLLAYTAPAGATPVQGNLAAYVVDGAWPARKVRNWQNAEVVRPVTSPKPIDTFWVRVAGPTGERVLERYRWTDSAVDAVQTLQMSAVPDASLAAIVQGSDGGETFVLQSTDGQLLFVDQQCQVSAEVPLQGLGLPTVSAADLDGDHRAELLVSLPQRRMRVYSFNNDGNAVLRSELASAAQWFDLGPVSYDLLGDGVPAIVRTSPAADGALVVSAARLEGEPLWQTRLDVAAQEVEGCQINTGQFLAADHAGVAVSVTDGRQIREGTYLLDGRTGQVQWFKSKYRDGSTIMPYRSRGVPTAIDYDGDGIEEVGMDLLSYMAFLRGADGSFAYVCPTRNIRTENAVYGGHLYNTYCPIFARPTDTRPHWFVIGGFGPFGVINPDPTQGIWRIDLGYDVPPKIGLVDIDGDGQMEVGYAADNDCTFVCRDLWTGAVEWELELPSPSNSPTYSADVDGDGKGEFLTASFCIGTNERGQGELRWQAPAATGWGAIADFDGDGLGEIVCQTPGQIVILHGNSGSTNAE